jgi:hypothetical protein
MIMDKPRKGQLINRINNKDDSEESDQAFQLHTLLVFTLLTSSPDSKKKQGKAVTFIF